ncbi:hypothetical protein [Tessaracoccus sp.]
MNNADDDETLSTQPRWPWIAAGFLLLASSALAAASIYLLWLPCQGSMLDGTMFGPQEVQEIAEGCSQRMDEGLPLAYFPEDVGRTPSASQLGGLAMMVASASWIVLILGLRLRRHSTWIALSAAVFPVIFAGLNLAAAINPASGVHRLVSPWLWLAVDVAALVIFVVLCTNLRSLGKGKLVGLGFVLWGATSFGLIHLLTDHFSMVTFNDYNWDSPPGTGWITVCVPVIAGAASLWVGRRRHASPPAAKPVSPPARERVH